MNFSLTMITNTFNCHWQIVGFVYETQCSGSAIRVQPSNFATLQQISRADVVRLLFWIQSIYSRPPNLLEWQAGLLCSIFMHFGCVAAPLANINRAFWHQIICSVTLDIWCYDRVPLIQGWHPLIWRYAGRIYYNYLIDHVISHVIIDHVIWRDALWRCSWRHGSFK